MKVSLEWLKEYTDIDIGIKELSDILTMTGSKVESIEEKGKNIKNVVVGKILEINPHPDADKLIVTKINIGNDTLQIVTAATNVKVGDVVPVAKDGAELVGDTKIKKGRLRGVESDGMMCGITEIGLEVNDFPNQIEDGIMILPEKFEKFIGKDIVEVLKMEEEILDFEITSNRPDCLSIEGLGREVAVSLGRPFKAPHKHLEDTKVEKKDEIEGIKVEVKNPELCYRYIARVVKDVKIEPSPEWMQRRLRACGIRVINNIVDITNYVMLELGQPLHAFDINRIKGKKIIVRTADQGEKVATLDGEERLLDTNDLVIADSDGAIAIAGVMGGLHSEIEEETSTVLFESAVFNQRKCSFNCKKTRTQN
jgi:phenylalanyl-tRNA synthetase beta chain